MTIQNTHYIAFNRDDGSFLESGPLNGETATDACLCVASEFECNPADIKVIACTESESRNVAEAWNETLGRGNWPTVADLWLA